MTGEAAKGLSWPGVFLAVALLSAGVLGYEILLALLGFGAAGSLVAVFQRPLLARFRAVFAGAALGFGAGAPLAFALAQTLPFNALEVAWERAQLGWLFALYLVLSLSFLSAALALAFRAHATRAGALYRMDLVGASLGALGMVFLLDALALADAFRAVGLAGAVAGAQSCCCGGVPAASRGAGRCSRCAPGSPCPRRCRRAGCARIPRPTRG